MRVTSHLRAALLRGAALATTLGLGVAFPSESFADDAGPAPAAANPPTSVDDAVERVQKFYDASATFQSDFVQEFVVKAYRTTKSSAGTVTFAKPGKMDWVYTTPKGNRVVSDGTLLHVYDAVSNQVYEQQVAKSQYPAALAFLTGQGKLADHFKFELHKGDALGFRGGFVLIGAPKEAHPAFNKVFFYVDTATSQVRRVLILDGQGNRNKFEFTTPKVNLKVPPAQFTFTTPPGATIAKP